MRYIVALLTLALLSGCCAHEAGALTRYNDVAAETEVDCASIYNNEKSLVVMGIGQSNHANSVPVRYTPRNAVYTFFKGKCYVGRDPVLGATGDGGSVLTRLADKVLDANPQYDNVIIVGGAVGGSSVIQWVWGNPLGTWIIVEQHLRLLSANIELDMILWHQGEADILLTTAQYKYFFKVMRFWFRYFNLNAPIYIAQASYCLGNSSQQIRDAQFQLAEEFDDLKHGPNTDTLDSSYRYDNCHFSDEGADVHANLWLDALTPDL